MVYINTFALSGGQLDIEIKKQLQHEKAQQDSLVKENIFVVEGKVLYFIIFV